MKIIVLLLMACGLNAQEIQCKCRQVEGDEYFCKCTALTGALPPSMVLATTAPQPTLNTKPMTSAGPLAGTKSEDTLTTIIKSQQSQLAPSGEIAAPKDTLTGQTTATGKTIYEGPRGGHYHYSASGKKVYEKHKK